MTEVVLDASAVLAVARREPGAELLATLRDRAVLSAVNAAEVYAKLLAAGLTDIQITGGLRAVIRRIHPFEDELARRTGAVHAATRQHGLSLADCACLALGQLLKATVYTADRVWADTNLGVRVEVIR